MAAGTDLAPEQRPLDDDRQRDSQQPTSRTTSLATSTKSSSTPPARCWA